MFKCPSDLASLVKICAFIQLLELILESADPVGQESSVITLYHEIKLTERKYASDKTWTKRSGKNQAVSERLAEANSPACGLWFLSFSQKRCTNVWPDCDSLAGKEERWRKEEKVFFHLCCLLSFFCFPDKKKLRRASKIF